MRNLKKFLALVLAMMMTLSLMVTVNASSFKDVEDTNTYVEAIDMLAALGVLKGQGADADGEFQPKGTITRAEMAAVLYRVVTGDVKDKNVNLYGGYKSFTDLNDGAWYIPYVNYCENNGLINGVGGGKFEPQEKLTGYQALVMILRAMGYNNPNEFSSSDWKLKASGYGRKLGITNRIEEGSLGAPIAREAVAEIVFQAIQKPTVSYNMLLGYTNDVLVAANKDKDGNWIYDHDVYNTLLYQVFGIVGKRTIYGGDGTYGRPMVDWVKDAKDDTVANGGKYIVNPQAPDTIAVDASGKGVNGVKNGSGADKNAVYVPVSTPGANYATMGGANAYIVDEDKTDVAVVSTYLAPVYIFNTTITECELTKAINNDKSIAWKNITEYVNGGLVKTRDDATGDDEMLDKLHTTNTGSAGKSDYTIGAQGRQTEIYNLGDIDNDRADEWIFVYIDTLLGEVEKVVPKTVDTAGHTVTPAELWIAVNDDITGDDAIVMKNQYDKNFTQQKGDKVLLTTWGLKDDTDTVSASKVDGAALIGATVTDTDGTAPVKINEHILNAVPDDEKDTTTTDKDGGALNLWEAYQTITKNSAGAINGKAWTVDLASDTVGENATVPTSTVTVDGTLGFSADKTGVISGGKNIYTTWAYHVDQPAADATHTTTVTDVADDTVLAKHHVVVTNQIIGQTFTAALDKNGNIVGMWQGTSDKIIGVVTDVDYVRIGLAKYAVEMEVFTTDSKTETVRLLDLTRNNDYFLTQDEADIGIKTDPDDRLGFGAKINPRGALVELTSYTKDGATYWRVSDKCTAVSELSITGKAPTTLYWGDQDTDGIVEPGKAGTLVGTTNSGNSVGSHEDIQVTDETVFIVAEYDFRYNTGSGNQGSNINVRYKVYNNFRDIPVINGADTTDITGAAGSSYNISFQMLDGKISANKEAGYVLISAFDANQKYTQSKPKTITVDDSFLVIAPIATYAEYSEYSVAKGGELTTIKVANVNSSVNTKLQAAIRTKGLMMATSVNGAGYITDAELLETLIAAGSTDPNYTLAVANVGNRTLASTKGTLITKGWGLTYSKGVLSWDESGDSATNPLTPDTYYTVAANCVVKIVNVDNGQLYPATLDHIKQYQADNDVVFELDANGWVSCLYIID